MSYRIDLEKTGCESVGTTMRKRIYIDVFPRILHMGSERLLKIMLRGADGGQEQSWTTCHTMAVLRSGVPRAVWHPTRCVGGNDQANPIGVTLQQGEGGSRNMYARVANGGYRKDQNIRTI